VKRWKDKNMATTTHQCKNPNNHYNHYNICGHKKEKCWELYQKFNTPTKNKDNKKKNLMATDLRN